MLRSLSDNLKNLIIHLFANIIITFKELKYLPKEKEKIHSYALKSVNRCCQTVSSLQHKIKHVMDETKLRLSRASAVLLNALHN